jgi:hypothetical protein
MRKGPGAIPGLFVCNLKNIADWRVDYSLHSLCKRHRSPPASKNADVFMKKSLVFVVGAGASKDFGGAMPIGTELADGIELALNREFGSERPSFQGPICTALERTGGRSDDHRRAADIIRRSLHGKDSIDDLLHDWRDDPSMIEVGKIAITAAISDAESKSLLNAATNEDLLTKIKTFHPRTCRAGATCTIRDGARPKPANVEARTYRISSCPARPDSNSPSPSWVHRRAGCP